MLSSLAVVTTPASRPDTAIPNAAVSGRVSVRVGCSGSQILPSAEVKSWITLPTRVSIIHLGYSGAGVSTLSREPAAFVAVRWRKLIAFGIAVSGRDAGV